jgi:hypothetical protein
MAYSTDMRVAAHRHFKSAQVLCAEKGAGLQPGCRAVAGYLFGLSGELAVKKIMKDSGMPPLPPERRRDDPYFAHFPALKKMLSTASGRRSEELRRIAENSSLFQNWDTNMRYAPTKDIQKNDIDAWETAAKALVESMEAE